MNFDGYHNGEVTVSGSLWSKVCGLCGDFDGDDTNDIALRDGTQVGSKLCGNLSEALERGSNHITSDYCLPQIHLHDGKIDINHI